MGTEHKHTGSEPLLGLLREAGDMQGTPLFDRAASGAGPAPWPRAMSRGGIQRSSLERRLFETYREELGRLLLDKCLRLLLEGPIQGGMVFANRVAGKSMTAMKPAAWRARASGTLAMIGEQQVPETAAEMLMRLISPAPGRAPSLLEIARAGLQLAPSEAFKIYEAWGLVLNGDTDGAQASLEAVYAQPFNHYNQLSTAAMLARLAHQRGDVQESLNWSEIAATGRMPYARGVLGWLFCALQAGDGRLSAKAADRLTFQFDASNQSISEFCTQKRADLLAGSWQPSAAAKRIRIHSSHDHVEKVLNLFR